jgi:hypothetical protein
LGSISLYRIENDLWKREVYGMSEDFLMWWSLVNTAMYLLCGTAIVALAFALDRSHRRNDVLHDELVNARLQTQGFTPVEKPAPVDYHLGEQHDPMGRLRQTLAGRSILSNALGIQGRTSKNGRKEGGV